MTAGKGTIRVGTSGWSYNHWRDRFYPPGLPQGQWLAFYQSRFPTVEINATFYRLPQESTVRRWREAAPPGFHYVVKGSRYITHTREPRERGAAVRTFLRRAEGLGHALAVVLWQFPSTFERDIDALRGFLATLPGGVRHAVELRHESWFGDETLELLRERQVALVAASSRELEPFRATTAGFVYCRFHGLGGGYAHDYSDGELQPWADWAIDAARRGHDGYCFFNNDAEGHAPKNALRFIEMIGDAAGEWGSRPLSAAGS